MAYPYSLFGEVVFSLPIAAACRFGRSAATIRQLIEDGADVNERESRGQTVLMRCFESQKITHEILKVLVDAGADVNAQDDSGSTVLHCALSYLAPTECIEELIRAGAKVDVADRNGLTPLHWAAMTDRSEVIKLLKENGADPEKRNKRGEKPVDIARQLGKSRAYAVLDSRYQHREILTDKLRKLFSSDYIFFTHGAYSSTMVRPKYADLDLVRINGLMPKEYFVMSEYQLGYPLVLEIVTPRWKGAEHLLLYEGQKIEDIAGGIEVYTYCDSAFAAVLQKGTSNILSGSSKDVLSLIDTARHYWQIVELHSSECNEYILATLCSKDLLIGQKIRHETDGPGVIVDRVGKRSIVMQFERERYGFPSRYYVDCMHPSVSYLFTKEFISSTSIMNLL